MLSLFKLKKKSKKGKELNQDDEKENTSSPTKVKKVEKSSSKKDSKSSSNENNNNSSKTTTSPNKKGKILNDKKLGDENSNKIINSSDNSKQQQQSKSPLKDNRAAVDIELALDTRGIDSPYRQQDSSKRESKPLVVDVTPTMNPPVTPLKQQQQQQSTVVSMETSTPSSVLIRSATAGMSTPIAAVSSEQQQQQQQASPISSNSTGTTINIQVTQPRAPVLSASDAANNSNSFIRGNFLSSTISGSDLNRYLNSGYIHGGDAYLQRGVDPKYPKSPHFHRPPNFSFYRNTAPNYVTPQRSSNRGAIRTLIMSSASTSSSARASRNVINKRVRSTSPGSSHLLTMTKSQDTGVTAAAADATAENDEIPVVRNVDNEEPIRLSKFSGGYEPDPATPHKIESLDWPAPPYPAAVPELRARSRSTSNRHGASTVQSVNGDYSDDSDEDITCDGGGGGGGGVNSTLNSQQQQHMSMSSANNTSAVSFNSRAKSASYRPKSKLKYRHNFFDNDYDDYLLAYKNDKEWRKTLNKNLSRIHNKSGESEPQQQESVEIVNEERKIDIDDGTISPAEKTAQEKLNKELEEIAKLENESSMAADLLKEIKAEQKMATRKLKVDPWKASRMPSAKAEPSIRTRFESPVNASPSRIFNYNRLTNTISGHTLSTTTTPILQTSTTASTSFFGDTSIASPNQSASNSTIIAGSSSNNAIMNTSSAALLNGNVLTTPPKSATLPANNQSNFSTTSIASSSFFRNNNSSKTATTNSLAAANPLAISFV